MSPSLLECIGCCLDDKIVVSVPTTPISLAKTVRVATKNSRFKEEEASSLCILNSICKPS